jgi:hypothetical protein
MGTPVKSCPDTKPIYAISSSLSQNTGAGHEELHSMQNAKDSFYMALRTRLATINPERTILLRGALRPGILAEGKPRLLSVSYPMMYLFCAGWAWAWIWI